MLSGVKLKQGLAGCCVDLVVVCKLHKWEPVSPVILSMAHKDPEVRFYLLVDVLHLAVGLQVVGGGRSQLNSEEGCKLAGEVGYKGGSMITDYFLLGAMMMPDMFKEELGNSSRVQGGDCGYGVDPLRQVVHHH